MSINFKEGQNVRQGQLLIKIDDRDWKAQLTALEVKLAKAKKIWIELKNCIKLMAQAYKM